MNKLALLVLFALSACRCGTDVAAPCDSDDDCATGLCFTNTEPGYCTADCVTEGATTECPADTVCKRIEGGDPQCILICDDDNQCPTNSECNDVPSSDGLRGCEPVL
jgi:hypothetical protein